MIHKPHGWVILKITTSEEVYYKIFGSWRGGYLNGEAWRFSSGSDKPPTISECGNYWVWPQESGSCYHLPVNEEDGYTFYTGQILSNIIIDSEESDALIERVELSSILS